MGFPRRPKRLLVEPPGQIIEAADLPLPVTLGKCGNQLCVITVKEFADDGVVVDTRKATVLTEEICGITVKMTMLEAAVVIAQPQEARPKASSEPIGEQPKPEVKVVFKDSPLFTKARKAHIVFEIDHFRRYLISVGFDVPKATPSIGVQTKKGLGPSYYWVYPGTIYDANFFIPADGIDDSQKIIESYAGYTFSVMLRTADTPPQDMLFLGESQMVIQKYYCSSFLNRVSFVPSEMLNVEKSLWDVRTKYGKTFTDEAVFYAIQRWRPSPPSSPAQNFNAYFSQRFLLGVDVKDNDQKLTDAIRQLFEANGVYPYPLPPAVKN